MVPPLVDQVRDRRSEADVQDTTDVRSAYAGRGVPTGHPQEVGLPFQQVTGLSDFLKLSVVLVCSISSDSRIVRESPPVSIHTEMLSESPRVTASLNPS